MLFIIARKIWVPTVRKEDASSQAACQQGFKQIVLYEAVPRYVLLVKTTNGNPCRRFMRPGCRLPSRVKAGFRRNRELCTEKEGCLLKPAVLWLARHAVCQRSNSTPACRDLHCAFFAPYFLLCLESERIESRRLLDININYL